MILESDEVHVWRVSLCLSPFQVHALKRLLAPDELSRADRFHFEEDRSHFIAARGGLRMILSRYLPVAPDRIRFFYNQYGKPFLRPSTNHTHLSFNLSHAADLALVAVTRQREIGVDLEKVSRKFDFEEIAVRFFSPNEAKALQKLPDHLKPEAFFNCWTRKEAYIKAHGEGLSIPLDSFDVSLLPGEPARFLSRSETGTDAHSWQLLALQPGPGYVGAVAVHGAGWRLKCWQWPD